MKMSMSMVVNGMVFDDFLVYRKRLSRKKMVKMILGIKRGVRMMLSFYFLLWSDLYM